jgi:hypothetical protein
VSIPDETLGAYVDGELDPEACAEIEKAADNDAGIAERIAQQRALRTQLQMAYAADLEEPVPDRLLAALGKPAPLISSSLTDLQAARAARARSSPRATLTPWRWRFSLAASVLVAGGLGFFAWRHGNPWVQTGNGTLVARDSLASGLSDQLSGEPAQGSSLRIGLSFVSKSGNYCRTFSLRDDTGLACRHAGRWEILVLTEQRSAKSSDSQFRTASSALTGELLHAVEEQISGDPLDRAGEIVARDKKWSAARPP